VFETAECEAVMNYIFWELRYEKHENQMKGYAVPESEWLADEHVLNRMLLSTLKFTCNGFSNFICHNR